MKLIQSKKLLVISVSIIGLVLVSAGLLFAKSKSNPSEVVQIIPTPISKPHNLLPISERPYLTLQPLTARNEVEIVLDDLKKPASELELVLEYDRNKGVLDAVLRTFFLTQLPLKDSIFLGSKSAGGHITYHDDVIGGDILLEFTGYEEYVLKTPWRYSDTETQFTQISTADGKFQVTFHKPYNTKKIIAMQSPGYPGVLDGEVVAGPYLFRGVGELPDTPISLKIRLTEDNPEVKLWGFDGTTWQPIEFVRDGKELTAETTPFEVFAVTK